MSYERMQQREDELQAKVEELLRAADAADAEEDQVYGKGRRGDELPAELERAESRRIRIRELRHNCQAAVDEAHQIIVAQAVTNQPPDVEHFIPMMEQVASNCGRMPHASSADAGYFSETNVECH